MPFKKKLLESEMPERFRRWSREGIFGLCQPQWETADFSSETVATVGRVDGNINVIGVMYMKDREIQLSTVPQNMSHGLLVNLPVYTDHVRHALSEIDVLDELVAYRLESMTEELLVAPAEDRIACVVLKMQKKHKKRHHHRGFKA